ncbi:MAG: sulfotransferase family protein [Rhodobacteraceae bacterium]|nr:sulfotransferase family protein [Paracoccaceae bacterium]
MILSVGRKYVFIHIPKTGGTSLALALEARAMKDDIMLGDTPKAKKRRNRLKGIRTRGRLWKHSTLSDIDGLVANSVLDDLFAFTLVRNPWDRAVSYYHWLQTQGFDHPAVSLAQDRDFTGFVTDPQTLSSFRKSPAASYMRRAAGDEQCNAFIRIEHFEEDSAPLVKHLGFRLSLPISNVSERQQDYRTYYTDQSAESLGLACAVDIARFGYGFDCFD